MGRITGKTHARAKAMQDQAAARREVDQIGQKYRSETDPVKKAGHYVKLVKAREKLQAANKVLRPNRRSK